jgi:hypothetical protein
MTKRIIFIPLLLFGVLIAAERNTDTQQTMTVTIDYGKEGTARTVRTSYENGATALNVLRTIAKVRTKKAGAFTFVTAIDGVRSTPGVMGWFFSVDGNHADRTASSFALRDTETMRWEYRADHCLK